MKTEKARLLPIVILVALALSLLLFACDKISLPSFAKNESSQELEITARFHNVFGPDEDDVIPSKLQKGTRLDLSDFESVFYDCTGIADFSGATLYDAETNRWLVNVFDSSFLSQFEKTSKNSYTIDLYCEWAPKQITLKLHNEKSDGAQDWEYQIAYGADLPTQLDVPTVSDPDYRFEGWYDGENAVTDANGRVRKAALLQTNYKFKGLTVQLDARFVLRTAQVFFDFGGIVGMQNIQKDITYGKTLTQKDYPEIPELPDQEAVGWSLASAYYVPCTDAIRQETLTLYAIWQPYRKIEFFDGDKLIDSIRVYNNNESVTHDAAKKGCRLEGWYDNEALSGNPVRINYGVANKLYARWEIITYTVTFSCDEKKIEPISYEYGDNIAFETLERVGYDFVGWIVAGSSGKTVYQSTKDLAENLSLSPKWSNSSYNVTLDKNGGAEDAIVYAIFDKPLPAFKALKRIGYSLAGYYTDALEGEQVINASGVLIANLNDYSDKDGNWVRGDGAKLYAHWVADRYEVKLKANTSVLPISLNLYDSIGAVEFADKKIKNVLTEQNDQYDIAGWYTDPSGGTKVADANGSLCANTAYTDSEKGWDYAGTVTLYAQWKTVGSTVYITNKEKTATVDGTKIYYSKTLSGIGASGSYLLVEDISLSGSWSPIASFGGTLDGNGKTISGLSISRSAYSGNDTLSLGMFGVLSGTVKNLTFNGASIYVDSGHNGTGYINAGIVAGTANSAAVIDKVDVSSSNVTVHRNRSQFGGIVGELSGKVTNCNVYGVTLYGNGSTGGIAGGATGTVSNCTVNGNGNTKSTIKHYAVSENNCGAKQIGGIIGYANGSTTKNCSVSNTTFRLEAGYSIKPPMGYIVGEQRGGTFSDNTVGSGCSFSPSRNGSELLKNNGFLGIGNYDYREYYFSQDNGKIGRKS